MCYLCTNVVVTDTELVGKNKPNFDKCEKHISVELPKVKINKYFREEDLRFLLTKVEDNNVELVKLHYLISIDETYKPYNISPSDSYKYDSIDFLPDCELQENRLANLTFLAQYHARYIAEHFLYHLEQLAAKKRRRRLQYKQNKKERGLKTNEPMKIMASEPELNACETVETEMMSNVLEKRASDCDCMVQ